MAIFRVFPENVTVLWPQLSALFEPVIAMTSTHTADDVRRALLAGAAQVWVQMDGDLVEAATTTEFINYPAGVFVRVWHAGAVKDRRLDTDGFLQLLTDWARTHQCIGFEAIGRQGWLRKVPAARVEGLVMRMVFARDGTAVRQSED